MQNRTPEILSPAGNPEKLRFAVNYGADAVYCALKEFGMRAAADNFTLEELDDALKALTSAWVSDSRWPPLPTSPGRFNVRETLDDLYRANGFLEKAMEKAGIRELRALYSPELMRTQIRCIEENLMSRKYFGEV